MYNKGQQSVFWLILAKVRAYDRTQQEYLNDIVVAELSIIIERNEFVSFGADIQL